MGNGGIILRLVSLPIFDKQARLYLDESLKQDDKIDFSTL